MIDGGNPGFMVDHLTMGRVGGCNYCPSTLNPGDPSLIKLRELRDRRRLHNLDQPIAVVQVLSFSLRLCFEHAAMFQVALQQCDEDLEKFKIWVEQGAP